MVFKVVFSPRSEKDLASIYRYISRDNPAAAEVFTVQLADQAQSLSKFPHQGGHLEGRPGLRFLVAARYLIIYRVIEDQREVRILNFWHSAREQRQIRGT